MTRPSGAALVELVDVIARLRAECAWKAAQTHRSLARYLLEETYETLDAIDSGDVGELRDELGDLLLQIYLHAEIARERGDFDIDDVARALTAKMLRRNPHVFGDAPPARPSSPAAVNELWESAKAAERPRPSLLDGMPAALPALLYADKVLDRLQRSGQRAGSGSADAAAGQARPQAGEQELGERLLALVAECREAGVDPEQALRDAVHRLPGTRQPVGDVPP